MDTNHPKRKPPNFQLGKAACCDSIGTVLKVLRQQRMSEWLCLLSIVPHTHPYIQSDCG